MAIFFRALIVSFCLFAVTSCATRTGVPGKSPQCRAAEEALRTSAEKKLTPETRAARLLHAAALALPLLDTPDGRRVYNQAASDLTILLRSANGGVLWNRPLTLTAGDTTYRLHFDQNAERGHWSPDFFTSFLHSENVPLKHLKSRNLQTGAGGALVGVRNKTPREPFVTPDGVAAVVTATLEFRGSDVTLALRDPGEVPQARIGGKMRPLEADFTAPFAYYRSVPEFWEGLMGALRVSHYLKKSGLYMLQPYDPHRIPIVFVHGLISTPQIWRSVVNEIESDPELRGRFQCWVFGYPTGTIMSYSALQLRRELQKARDQYGLSRGMVLVGHSMGGLLAQMQTTTIRSGDWDQTIGPPLTEVFRQLPPDSVVHQSLLVEANPQITRTIFICTPHRGSKLAVGGIGWLAEHLIALPGTIAGELKDELADALPLFSGEANVIPDSITSLAPDSPTLRVMEKLPVQGPYHTILGDRGRGNSPDSSDGVVEYRSSHLEDAESECIVPGPHGSAQLPETIAELKRILKLHLNTEKP